MKKTVVILMVVAILCCGLALSACNGDGKLQMDKKYVYDDVQEVSAGMQTRHSYYVFHKDGTGEYTFHYDYPYSRPEYENHIHYTIHFKYTWVDDEKSAVVCFYDSHEVLDGDDGKSSNIANDWSELLTVSKNVIAYVGSSGYTFYVNEDYLKTIPNYNKEARQ